MTNSASELELESDTSSVDGIKDSLVTNEQFLRCIESLRQENRVLRTEVETLKLKVKGLNDLNEQLRRNSVSIQAKTEQEEEYISNTLLKKITELKKEKELLALNYEQEEECLTNELSRKFTQLREEKVALERSLAREQENQVSKLMRRIEKLEADMNQKQDCLDRLRREKIELENSLEQEQEALVNRLWKKIEKLESERRILREKLETVEAPLPNLSLCETLNSSSDGISLPGNSAIPRPTSSGPGSLRSSFRQHADPLQASPSGSVAVSLPTVTFPISPGKVSVSSAGEEKVPQSNQSSCILNGDVCQKSNVSESNSAPFPLPPQSSMDIDASDPNASGATSPSGSLNSLPAISNHPHSSSCLSTTSVNNVLTTQNHSASNQTQDTTHSTAVHVISTSYVNRLHDEVCRLRQLLRRYEAESTCKMPEYESEEKSVTEENRRLRKLLQVEKERREALSRQLSESESSLEMEDERQFNEATRISRLRTISDCTPPFLPHVHNNTPSSLYGPGHAFAVAVAASVSSSRVCRKCGQPLNSPCSGDPSDGRSLSTSLHNSSYAGSTRNCSGRCCSPISNLSTSEVQGIQASNSPSTPTTSSINSDRFVKPIYPAAASPQQNAFFYNRMPSSLSPDSNRSSASEKRFSTIGISCKDIQKQLDFEDGDEEDDARCVTPPSCRT